jgi:MFS family permease
MADLRPPPAAAASAPVSLVPLAVASLMVGVGLGCWTSLATVMLAARGLGDAGIGLAASAGAIAFVVSVPAWGHVADTLLGRARSLAVAALIVAVLALAFGLPKELPPVAAGVLYTLITGMTAPWLLLVDAITVNVTHDAAAYARIRLLASLAYAATSIAVGIAAAATSLATPPILLAVAALGIAAAARGLPDVGRAVLGAHGSRVQEPGGRVDMARLLGSTGEAFRLVPGLPILLLAALLAHAGHASQAIFMGPRIVTLGGGPAEVTLASGSAAAVEIPCFFMWGWVAGRWGLRASFAGGALIYALVAAIWATTDSVPVTILARTLSGAGYSALAISGTLAMRSLLPRALAATGQGMYQVTAAGLASVVAGVTGPALIGAGGYPLLFAAIAISIALGAAVGFASFPHAAPRRPTRSRAPV